MSKIWMYVGGGTRPLPYFKSANAQGIAAFAFDEATGRAEPAGVTVGIDNPTYIALRPDGRALYATSEVLGWNEGTVSAYALDPATGALAYVNKQPTRGPIAAQASFSRAGDRLFVVNYGDGPMTQKPNRALAVFPLEADGEIGPAIAEVVHEGSGPDPARQDRPHPHNVQETPDGRHLLVSDLGLDALILYRLDADGLTERARLAMPPGAGPRHFAFHPRLSRLYVANELDSTVGTVDLDGERLTLRATTPATPKGVGDNHCSEIRTSPDGRWLLVANRGHDSLARFSISPAGDLTPAGHAPSGGRTPRHFAFSPSGRWLAVANQDSDVVTIFAFSDGELTERARVAAGTPTAVVFAG